MDVVVVPANPAWELDFEVESRQLRVALDGLLESIHHIGSTAIRGIHAKPIIDILLVVTELAGMDRFTHRMQGLGYEALGEFGIPGRRYFRKNGPEGKRTHQVHAFQLGSDHIVRHLAFRDYMNAQPALARAYGELKLRLASMYPRDIESYMDGKDGFIKEYEARAVQWVLAGRPNE